MSAFELAAFQEFSPALAPVATNSVLKEQQIHQH